MTIFRGKSISELVTLGSLTPETLVEIELNGNSGKCTVAELFTAMGDQFMTGDQIRLLLQDKMAIGGSVENALTLGGMDLDELTAHFQTLTVAGSDTLGGYTPDDFATQGDIAALQVEISRLAGILNQLFDSLSLEP